MLKFTIRSQSQLLPRRSYKPSRNLRIRPASGLNLLFRPTRAGPPNKFYECKTP